MRTLIIIWLVLLLAACKKTTPQFDGVNCSGNCYILTGKVLDTPSNAGLQGVELKVYYRPAGYSLFMDPTRYLGRTTTNASGEYKFQFDGSEYKTGVGYYRIQATKAGYFYNPTVFNLDSTQFNIAFNQNIAMLRPASLIVRVRASTVTSFQFLTFSYHYGKDGTGIVLNGGRPIDTTITYQTAGDIRTFVEWHTSGNAVNIGRNDTLFTTAGGTIQYQINL